MSIRSYFYLGLLLVLLPFAHAQQAMEMYIPIGESVGVSNITTIIGKVVAFDVQNKTFSLSDASGTTTIAVPDGVPVWLDRSHAAGGTNQLGSLSDLKPELRVEVKYREESREPLLTAEWVKVEIPR